MGLGDKGFVVVDGPIGGGVLQQHPKDRRRKIKTAVIAHHHLNTEGNGAGSYHVNGLGVTGFRHPEGRRILFLAGVKGQGHRFRRRRALIEQRSIGDFHPGQVGDQGLVVQQCL